MTHDDGWVFPLILMLEGGSSGGDEQEDIRGVGEGDEKREGATVEGVTVEERTREEREGGEKRGDGEKRLESNLV